MCYVQAAARGRVGSLEPGGFAAYRGYVDAWGKIPFAENNRGWEHVFDGFHAPGHRSGMEKGHKTVNTIFRKSSKDGGPEQE